MQQQLLLAGQSLLLSSPNNRMQTQMQKMQQAHLIMLIRQTVKTNVTRSRRS